MIFITSLFVDGEEGKAGAGGMSGRQQNGQHIYCQLLAFSVFGSSALFIRKIKNITCIHKYTFEIVPW